MPYLTTPLNKQTFESVSNTEHHRNYRTLPFNRSRYRSRTRTKHINILENELLWIILLVLIIIALIVYALNK